MLSISPDFPAYSCYAIVLLVGAFVAWSAVRTLLLDLDDRLAFGATWLLLLVFTLLPVVLFWLLDSTSAIRDTALFAAIFVGIAYQQIFAGAVREIPLPGTTQALWLPFQRWVKSVADRISTKRKLYRDRFEQKTLREIEGDQKRACSLTELLQSHGLLEGLQKQLDALPKEAKAARINVQWKALKADDPEGYGDVLLHWRIINRGRHWWFLKRGRAKLVTGGMIVALAITALSVWGAFFLPSFSRSSRITPLSTLLGSVFVLADGSTGALISNRERIQLWYYRWRLRKTNTSADDRARTADFIMKLAKEAQAGSPKSPPFAGELPDSLKALDYVLGGVLHDFCSEAELSAQADRILPLVYRLHSQWIDQVIVERLLDCLQTSNIDIRIRIHQTLCYLAQTDFPQVRQPPETLLNWLPVKDEPMPLVDACTRAWKAWWLAQFHQVYTGAAGVCDPTDGGCLGPASAIVRWNPTTAGYRLFEKACHHSSAPPLARSCLP